MITVTDDATQTTQKYSYEESDFFSDGIGCAGDGR